MADNVTIDNGALTDFDAATDDVGGKHYQRVKLDVGGDGASVPVEGEMPVGGDVAHDAADSGNPVKIGGRANTGSPTAVTSGDRVEAWFTLDGALQTNAPYGTSVLGGNSGELADVAGTGSSAALNVGGNVAHDAADSGNPVKIGGKAESTTPAAVADGDRVDAWFGTRGEQVVAIDSGLVEVVLATTSVDNVPNTDGAWAITSTGSSQLDTRLNVYDDVAGGWHRGRGDLLGIHVSRQATAETATLANVAGSASSVTLRSSNAARKGLTIWNDSSAILYVKFGTTASTTSCTVKMIADAYYEVPFGYTGRVDGIWASATGSARMTELT